jgi:uncharacterized protein involved in type VI secretion and phage assembly
VTPITTDELVVELAERTRSRYYGKYMGVVTDVEDPESMLRIRATVPALFGDTVCGWALPCVPFAGDGRGMFFLPEVADSVWIEFEAGDPSHPIWSGCFWRVGELPSDAAPQVRGLVTRAGVKLLIDDDGEVVTLEDGAGNKVTLDSAGITLERGSQKVVVGDSSVSIDDGAFEVK